MKYRVSNCLVNGKIVECAILPGGKRRQIETVNNHKCFSVDDYIDKRDHLLRTSFTNKIGNAVQAVRDGAGDVIQTMSLFGEHISVLYFLDREYGEEMRRKTMDGWKDAKFAYALKFCNKDSMSGGYFINKNLCVIIPGISGGDILLFDTEGDALLFSSELIVKAHKYAKDAMDEYLKIKIDHQEDVNIFTIIENKIEKEYGVMVNILLDMAAEFWKEDLTGMNGNLKLEKHYFQQVQFPIK